MSRISREEHLRAQTVADCFRALHPSNSLGDYNTRVTLSGDGLALTQVITEGNGGRYQYTTVVRVDIRRELLDEGSD